MRTRFEMIDREAAWTAYGRPCCERGSRLGGRGRVENVAYERPKGGEQFDENYWLAYKARERKRWSARFLLFVIGPVTILISILKVIDPINYPPGDLRNAWEFRLLVFGGFVVLGLALIIGAFRWLRADARDPE
jgi:hypothetical protein